MRSLHVCYRVDNRVGGIAHATLNLAKYLVDAGEVAEVASTYGPGDEVEYIGRQYSELRIRLFARSFPTRYSNSEALGRWLRGAAAKYDVVELHGVFGGAYFQGARACHAARVPYIVRPHGTLDPYDLRKHRLLKMVLGPVFVRPYLAESVAMISATENESGRVVTYGASPRRFVVPLPVPLEAFTGDGARFRAKHLLPHDASVVLYLARIDDGKGLEFLIPALAGLKPKHPGLRFVLAGGGPATYVAGIRRLLHQHGIAGWTVQPGFLCGQEKQDALAAADVFALPSVLENFGIVAVEALAAGTPVLISNGVPLHPHVSRAQAGMVCRASTAGCVEGLGSLLSLGAGLKEMGERCRALAKEVFSPEASTRQLLEVYRKVGLA